MTEDIVLTDIERAAKEHFLLHFREGGFIPCDVDISTVEAKLPTWYDAEKYKRGQKYFWQNRFGIYHSNMIGLICLLAEPRGLRVLASTGRSSTIETARKRYVQTVLHALSWYEYDLTPGSKAWESITKVRKMHFLASKSAESKNIGKISQSEISFTAFGFMGFVMTRPHLLNIKHDNREDLEGFFHLWAVLLHMLGVQDKYNICLQPYEVLEVICRMFLRYVLIPLIQIEIPEFQHMVSVMLDGLSLYLPNMNYEFQLFEARRVVGVPGYQYSVDLDKEIHCRTILTKDEINECNESIFKLTKSKYLQISYDIPIIECNFIKINNNENSDKYTIINVNEENQENVMNSVNNNFMKVDLKLPEDVKIRYVNYEKEWKTNLNDSKFHELSGKGQRLVRTWVNLFPYYENSFCHYISEAILSLILYWMKRALKNMI